MATVTISVDAGGAGNMARQKTVSGAHLTRFVAACRKRFNTGPGPTDAEVLETWADYVFAEGRAITRGVEMSDATLTVTDIDFA